MGEILKIDAEAAEAAVVGGAVLGGGGGGWIEDGKELAHRAIERGFSEILPLTCVPPDGTLLTVSAVGAPSVLRDLRSVRHDLRSAGRESLTPEDYVRAVELFMERTGIAIDGLVSNEIGAAAVVNGWLQSAMLKIPVIDAPANGRAHPTGIMGSMGLHRVKDYVSIQAVVGGDAAAGTRVEAMFEGTLEEVSRRVREAAVRAGGMVAVARNPVSASYVREHGAPGAIAMALGIGKIWMRKRRARAERKLAEVRDALGAEVMIRGTVERVQIKTEGGFDSGVVVIRAAAKSNELTFWNEYMTLEEEGKRIATFPDLIMTFGAESAMPLISAEMKEGAEVVVLAARAKGLILGAGMRDARLFEQAEKAIGKNMVKFITW
jgi:DUF917 family protein